MRKSCSFLKGWAKVKLKFWGPGEISELGWAVFVVEIWNFKVTVNLGGYTLLYI